MKKLLCAIAIMFAFQTYSSHILAGQMTYKCIGGNDYEITLNMYYECSSPLLNGDTLNQNIWICSQLCSQQTLIQIQSDTGVNVASWCAPLPIDCNASGAVVARKYTFIDTITLSMTCSDWHIYVDHCCRNGAITNLVNPNLFGKRIECHIDNSTISCNNSPTFDTEPIIYACCNQGFGYDQSATDLDGDSLAYTLYNARSDGSGCSAPGSDVVYQAGFDSINFVSSVSPISLNPLTGVLSMEPNNCFQSSVYALRIDEYRNGVKIGSIMRDVTVYMNDSTITSSTSEPLVSLSILSLYPNPAKEVVTIQMSGFDEQTTLLIMDNNGREIETLRRLSSQSSLDVSNYSNGLYFFVIKNNGVVSSSKRLVIMHE